MGRRNVPALYSIFQDLGLSPTLDAVCIRLRSFDRSSCQSDTLMSIQNYSCLTRIYSLAKLPQKSLLERACGAMVYLVNVIEGEHPVLEFLTFNQTALFLSCYRQ